MNELGITSIHFPRDDTTFRQLRSGDFDLEVLQRATALCDTPVVPYYPQLDEAFPGSKFILTLRDDREAWLASVERLWRSRPHILRHPYDKFITAAVYGTWHFSRSRFAYVYDTHVRNVRPTSRAERRTCWNSESATAKAGRKSHPSSAWTFRQPPSRTRTH